MQDYLKSIILKKWSQLLSALIVIILIYFFIEDMVLLNNYDESTDSDENVFSFDLHSLFDEWHSCAMSNMANYGLFDMSNPDEFYRNAYKINKECDKVSGFNQMGVEEFANRDDVKYSILPKKPDNSSTIITLGVGYDTGAEKLMKEKWPGSIKFYGADPFGGQNEVLYSQIGTFAEVAVGAETKLSLASVQLKRRDYHWKTVLHLGLAEFITKIVRNKFIDNLLIDNEYAEFDMFQLLNIGDGLDLAEITVCQFNFEVHPPKTELQKNQFQKFFVDILKDKRYMFYKVLNGQTYRLFVINMTNKECVNKYFGQ